jgi:HD superfamily phosphohydrolase
MHRRFELGREQVEKHLSQSKSMDFADVVHQSITFSRKVPSQALILDLVDNRWLQRLRDISQTANTRLVYMFSEHSRFGHCLGVAYLTTLLLEKLEQQYPDEIAPYKNAVCAAAILHDIGHLAPGSHTAFKTWFPDQEDIHEEIAIRLILEDPELNSTLKRYGEELPQTVQAILKESDEVPPWTWEIISGGGWNVDRGNWCTVDSILAGVSYGKYNIPALTDSIMLTSDRHLALKENRLDAMMHFALSRHAMYRQIYQHRVILSADTINLAIVQRARDLRAKLDFCDDTMRKALDAKSPHELTLDMVFQMREYWWRYHLARWSAGSDAILADLSQRLLNRRLFKTIRISQDENREALLKTACRAVEEAGYDPRYYFHQISTVDMHSGDYKQSIRVQMDDGRTRSLTEAEPLFNAMLRESHSLTKSWLVMPESAKLKLGRDR